MFKVLLFVHVLASQWKDSVFDMGMVQCNVLCEFSYSTSKYIEKCTDNS